MTHAKPRAIIALDLLRFASALLVVAFHFGSAFALAPSYGSAAILRGLPVAAHWSPVSWFGWVGVEIFFVISGFVIALSAEGSSTAQFVRRRALRLLPAAWICATVTLAALVIAAPSPSLVRQWLVAVTFWPTGAGIDPSYWTLGIELVFYLVIASGLGACGRIAAIERRGLWIGAVSLGFWVFALLAGPAATPMIDFRPAQLLLLTHGCFFTLGILAWSIVSRGATRERVIVFAVFYATALIEIAARANERTAMLGIEASPLIPSLVFSAGLAIVLGAVRLQPLLARHCRARTTTTLGLMTYPLYLIHQEAGATLVAAAMRAGVPFDLALLLALVTALAFSWGVARIAEPVLRAWLGEAIDRISGFRALRRGSPPSAFPPAG